MVSKEEIKVIRKALKQADKELRAYGASLPKGGGDAKFDELNAKANAIAKKLPWYYR